MRQKLLATMMIVAAVFAASATTPAINAAPAMPSPRLAVPSGQTVAQPSQARGQEYLIKEVRHELVMLPYYSLFDWLSYQVQPDGTVILSGQVVRPTLKSDAENVVKKIEGVGQVVNQIEVLPLSPMDDQIRRNVARALFNFDSPLSRYGLEAVPSIHIIVKNGNVTLKGVVDNKTDSQIAYMKANGVPSVFRVENDLTVQKG